MSWLHYETYYQILDATNKGYVGFVNNDLVFFDKHPSHYGATPTQIAFERDPKSNPNSSVVGPQDQFYLRVMPFPGSTKYYPNGRYLYPYTDNGHIMAADAVSAQYKVLWSFASVAFPSSTVPLQLKAATAPNGMALSVKKVRTPYTLDSGQPNTQLKFSPALPPSVPTNPPLLPVLTPSVPLRPPTLQPLPPPSSTPLQPHSTPLQPPPSTWLPSVENLGGIAVALLLVWAALRLIESEELSQKKKRA